MSNVCYEGRVIEVEGDVFTAELIDCEDRSVVHADFPFSVLSGAEQVEPGDILDVIVQEGKASVSLRDLGKWTEEDLKAAQERGRQRAVEFSALFD